MKNPCFTIISHGAKSGRQVANIFYPDYTQVISPNARHDSNVLNVRDKTQFPMWLALIMCSSVCVCIFFTSNALVSQFASH